MTTVAIDAMGGDRAPGAVIEAVRMAITETKADFIVVGPETELRKADACRHPRVSIAHASSVIGVDEQPVQAFRTKKDSSIGVALSLVKEGKADVCISAGSTGALLAGGLLTLGRIKGIDRPALTVIVPSELGNPLMLLDVGANTDVKPRNLKEFALMASVYADRVLGINLPRVGLLNIGTEETKGTDSVKAAYAMLRETKSVNFVGNIEARDLFCDKADVVVCDGFVGNMVIKSVEGVVGTLFGLIKQEIGRDLRSKLGGLLVKPYLKRVALRLDYSEHGGAPLLGLAAPCVKCHGSSDSRAILNGIKVAIRYTEQNVTGLVKMALHDEESASDNVDR